MSKLFIRQASIQDAELIIHFIKDLARYEKAEHEVKADVTAIKDSIFSEHSTVESIICLLDDKPIGFAVYFYNYSTWLGKNGLYLEDLYVAPEYRQLGAGKYILKHLATLAVSKGCERFEWSVLDWNTPAIDFYEAIGAKPKSEWIGYQLAGQALLKFANKP